jgi:disulfide bond formation protein DsbB
MVSTLMVSLAGAGFAIRQLYLQSLPAGQAPACGAPVDYLISQSRFGELLSAMTSGTGDCATVTWQFLGISLPGWSLLGFAALALLAVLQLRAGNNA